MPERLPEHVSAAFLPHPPRSMGVAVSGGSDSMALLHLMQEFCALHGIDLHAVTVDHGLRAEAASEAETVAQHCASLGVPHDTIVWRDWSGKGNLQQAARNARYSKMADWARTREITTIAVGHTADDQAETLLMRLSRRSGVDGLSGMSPRTVREGITWVRPLLKSRRSTLQTYLQAQDIGWINDPSNDDDRFDRIKARKALGLLSELGISAEVLADVAAHLGEARRALDWQTFLAAKEIVQMQAGALVLDEKTLALQPDEIQRRLFVRAVQFISGSSYAPRRGTVASAFEALKTAQAATLDGCHIRRIAGKLWAFREYNAVRWITADVHDLWDGHWYLLAPSRSGSKVKSYQIRALGPAGLEHCPDWRATGLPYVMLQSTPSVWDEDRLIAAPHAGYPQNWRVEPACDTNCFFATLLSH